MRILNITIYLLLLAPNFIFGQNHNCKLINSNELELLNDLSSSFKEVNTTIVISSLILNPVDSSSLNIPYLEKKYGFNKNRFANILDDTIIIKDNKYFSVINKDTLINYGNRNSTFTLEDNLLTYLEKYYENVGLCYFSKPVFSRNKSYAIAEYIIWEDIIHARGEIVLMKRMKNKWVKFDTLVVFN